MIIQFDYGFTYGGIQYGWYKKNLYRLPYYNKSSYRYSLKELIPIYMGVNRGYRLSGIRLALSKLEELTHKISYTYESLSDVADCPF